MRFLFAVEFSEYTQRGGNGFCTELYYTIKRGGMQGVLKKTMVFLEKREGFHGGEWIETFITVGENLKSSKKRD